MNYFDNEMRAGSSAEATIELLPSEHGVLKDYVLMMKDFFTLRGVPISETTCNQETGEFVLEFVTPETSQAYDEICHGGFSTTVLDAIARLAILKEGLRNSRDDSKYQSSTKYMRKVSVGAKIRVVGKVDSSEGVGSRATAYVVDVSKPTKVLAKYTLDLNDEEGVAEGLAVENNNEEGDGKSLLDVSKESQMLEHYLLASQKFYQSNDIPITEAVWNQEKKEITFELVASHLNCVNGVLEDGVIATLLDTLAGLPVFLESTQKGRIALSDELSIVSLGQIKEGSTLKIVGKIDTLDENKSKSSAWIVDTSNPTQALVKASLTMKIV